MTRIPHAFASFQGTAPTLQGLVRPRSDLKPAKREKGNISISKKGTDLAACGVAQQHELGRPVGGAKTGGGGGGEGEEGGFRKKSLRLHPCLLADEQHTRRSSGQISLDGLRY